MATETQIRLMNTFNLTPGQKRIVELLMKGLSNKEVGNELHITEKAVRCQLTKLYKSTKIESRPRLMTFFAEKGWFTVHTQSSFLPRGRE